MNIILRRLLFSVLFIFYALPVNSADKFETIKNKLELSTLVHLEVIITVESKIFNDIDSTYGDIYFATDGRYLARIGDDLYLNDSLYQWEYVSENNQVMRRSLKNNGRSDNHLVFYKNLDAYYRTKTISPDYQYRLYKSNKSDDALPDSMTIFLEKENSRISRFEYYDLNEDLNKIYIVTESYSDKIPNYLFDMDIPDSAEIIILP
jgi:outer membrane lipoprotein-sorting protein